MFSVEVMAPACCCPPRYTLYSMLYHHNVSADGGHYTLDMLHPNSCGNTISAGVTGSGSSSGSKTWLHIDDKTVISVQHEDIFGHSNCNGKERSDDHSAYLLLY